MSEAEQLTPPALQSEVLDEEQTTRELGLAARTLRQTAFWMSLVVIGLIALFSIISPQHAFFQLSNFEDMSLDVTETMMLALGMTLILGAGELDLSIGANLLLSSVLAGNTIVHFAGTTNQVAAGTYPHEGIAILLGIVVGILSGVAFGVINGLLVTTLRISSFIVTLGTTGIGTGIAFVMTDGVNVAYVPQDLQLSFGVNRLWGVIPLPTLVVIVAAAVLWYTMAATRFGLHTLAIGSSREASVRAGLNVRRHVFVLFVIMGFLAGVDGVLDLARFGTTNVGGHQTDALAAIAAVVIGGTSLFGGAASIGGSMIGSLIPVVLGTGLVILGVATFYQLIVVGIILIIAVYIDQRRRNRLV
jgi:ribose transport system permease protein